MDTEALAGLHYVSVGLGLEFGGSCGLEAGSG